MSDPTDIMNMDVRALIKGLRKKASELSDDHLITILFNSAVVNRLEQEADRADAAEAEERAWRHECRLETEKVEILLKCKPSAEALDQIADIMHHMKAPSEYVTAINQWSDHVRKADAILGTQSGPKTERSSGETPAEDNRRDQSE